MRAPPPLTGDDTTVSGPRDAARDAGWARPHRSARYPSGADSSVPGSNGNWSGKARRRVPSGGLAAIVAVHRPAASSGSIVHPSLARSILARFIQRGVIRTMDLSQDALLPILLLTIVANICIVAVLLASGRLGRGKQVATATTHASGFESTIMSSSYDDHAT